MWWLFPNILLILQTATEPEMYTKKNVFVCRCLNSKQSSISGHAYQFLIRHPSKRFLPKDNTHKLIIIYKMSMPLPHLLKGILILHKNSKF